MPTASLAAVTPAAKGSFTISELAAEFDVTPRTIRFYEAERLIAPKRAGQARIYSKRDRARLGWILRGKRVGFSLAEIAELLDMYDSAGPAKQHRALAERVQARIAALEAQRRDLDATIDELKQFTASLDNRSGAAAEPQRRTVNA